MDAMTNLAMWSGIVGFFLPPLLAQVMRAGWPAETKAVVAFVACLLAGAGTAWFSGQLSGKDVVTAVLIVVVTTQATYQGFWKPTGVAKRSPAANENGV